MEKYPLTQDGLKQLVIDMRQAGLQPISCNNRIRCVNAYLKWLGSPLRLAKLREETKVLPIYTKNSCAGLAGFRPKNFSDVRLHVLVLTLMDTGMRIDEPLPLKKSQVNLDQMLFTVMGKGPKRGRWPSRSSCGRVSGKYLQITRRVRAFVPDAGWSEAEQAQRAEEFQASVQALASRP